MTDFSIGSIVCHAIGLCEAGFSAAAWQRHDAALDPSLDDLQSSALPSELVQNQPIFSVQPTDFNIRPQTDFSSADLQTMRRELYYGKKETNDALLFCRRSF
ncbi:MAG: hypothetical protein J6S73_08045, partial [Lentisphaeria bacterium]|nr:hypothetical protein [Lentisphaeria bacterium]